MAENADEPGRCRRTSPPPPRLPPNANHNINDRAARRIVTFAGNDSAFLPCGNRNTRPPCPSTTTRTADPLHNPARPGTSWERHGVGQPSSTASHAPLQIEQRNTVLRDGKAHGDRRKEKLEKKRHGYARFRPENTHTQCTKATAHPGHAASTTQATQAIPRRHGYRHDAAYGLMPEKPTPYRTARHPDALHATV